MNSRTTTWIFITLYSIFALKYCHSYNGNNVKIVTYGEPCVTTHQLPIKIEGPKPPVEEPKIPVSLDFRVISDMYVKPRRVEYPIEIEEPCAPSSSPSEKIIKDTLQGKSYTYNIYAPPVFDMTPSEKQYNFAVQVPMSTEHNTEQCQRRYIQRLKGLKSRIDKILVPACEVSSSSSC